MCSGLHILYTICCNLYGPVHPHVKTQLLMKVKIKNCVNGTEGNSVVGLSARFGSSLPSHASKALKTSAVLANPFNCCTKLSMKVYLTFL
ncbi:uncharacterized protein A4U43_C09F14450 [Asparagus officinalis]|uniref:Uncharacterized protein n=1 Tax=Asparagus officinalis TaxID=4686 RepID=A0A5P1E7C8_ASPOF|nr:uncharacterized protein A4U43_C09F14450 [Asparagus officinalis]